MNEVPDNHYEKLEKSLETIEKQIEECHAQLLAQIQANHLDHFENKQLHNIENPTLHLNLGTHSIKPPCRSGLLAEFGFDTQKYYKLPIRGGTIVSQVTLNEIQPDDQIFLSGIVSLSVKEIYKDTNFKLTLTRTLGKEREEIFSIEREYATEVANDEIILPIRT